MRDMTHSYVWHDSFICVTWLIHMCDMTHSYVWHDSFIGVTGLIHTAQHFQLSHLLYSYVTWRIHVCDVTHLICVTWLIHMYDMTHSCVSNDPFIYPTWLFFTHESDREGGSKLVYIQWFCSTFFLNPFIFEESVMKHNGSGYVMCHTWIWQHPSMSHIAQIEWIIVLSAVWYGLLIYATWLIRMWD